MIQDDKIGICFGRLAPMDEFGSFEVLMKMTINLRR